MNKVYISYEDIENAVLHTAGSVVDSYELPSIIVGIVRGGMIPAYLVAKELKIPLMMITWQTRDGSIKESNQDLINILQTGRKVLFVDDINDSGKTLNQLIEYYSSVAPSGRMSTAALFEKDHSDHMLSFVPCKIFDKDDWVVFPWELG
ncbi:MAG: hypothetical protein JHC38_04125 [Thiotrichales bacterium]|nr:hypothetical protein [Thiotrichales bacterium]